MYLAKRSERQGAPVLICVTKCVQWFYLCLSHYDSCLNKFDVGFWLLLLNVFYSPNAKMDSGWKIHHFWHKCPICYILKRTNSYNKCFYYLNLPVRCINQPPNLLWRCLQFPQSDGWPSHPSRSPEPSYTCEEEDEWDYCRLYIRRFK